jgi:hypothetical protein
MNTMSLEDKPKPYFSIPASGIIEMVEGRNY